MSFTSRGTEDTAGSIFLIAGDDGKDINPATKLVIPAVAERRVGIQKRLCSYWILAFARMAGWWISDGLFHS